MCANKIQKYCINCKDLRCFSQYLGTVTVTDYQR